MNISPILKPNHLQKLSKPKAQVTNQKVFETPDLKQLQRAQNISPTLFLMAMDYRNQPSQPGNDNSGRHNLIYQEPTLRKVAHLTNPGVAFLAAKLTESNQGNPIYLVEDRSFSQDPELLLGQTFVELNQKYGEEFQVGLVVPDFNSGSHGHVLPILISQKQGERVLICFDSIAALDQDQDCYLHSFLQQAPYGPKLASVGKVYLSTTVRQRDLHSCRADALAILSEAVNWEDPIKHLEKIENLPSVNESVIFSFSMPLSLMKTSQNNDEIRNRLSQIYPSADQSEFNSHLETFWQEVHLTHSDNQEKVCTRIENTYLKQLGLSYASMVAEQASLDDAGCLQPADSQMIETQTIRPFFESYTPVWV